MNMRDYREWVDSKVHSFANLLPEKRNPAALLEHAMQTTFRRTHTLCMDNFIIYVNLWTAETVIMNVKTMKSAKAKCHNTDTFNIYVGIAVAWAKYNHEIVPKCENTINRDELKNGDKFISSVSKNKVITFIGWIPDCNNGMIGKWAIVLDKNSEPVKTQVAKEVVKMN